MSRLKRMWMLALVAVAVSTARGQDSTAPAQDNSQQQPVPAYGQESSPAPITENPPISGLDQPGLEPHSAPLSYLQPGATVSESADSNITNGLGGSTTRSVSRALGSLTLQRLWSHYDLALQYVGGVGYYDQKGIGWKLMQQMDLDQKITWKRGKLSVRDSFSYLPEGTFGAAYGSLGSQGIESLGNTGFGGLFGGATLGTLGLVPRLANVSVAEVEETLTPKSAITALGGYGLVHFYGNDPLTQMSYLNNSQTSGQVGYNRIISAHDQIALVYGYQRFDFSSIGTSFHSNVVQLMYGHRVSGRMDFLVGAGPQITDISATSLVCSLPIIPAGPQCTGAGFQNVQITEKDRKIGVAIRGRLRYRFPRTSVDLTYLRHETSGSGFFAGAQTDEATLRADRPLSRVWSGFADLGYARNSRLLSSGGIPAKTYNSGFAGVGVHRAFGRNFHGFISYQFNELAFDSSICGAGSSGCSHIGHRHVGTIGLDWTPRPIRID